MFFRFVLPFQIIELNNKLLKDLMESNCFSSVMLEKIFRQAGESDIVWNAHRINRGEFISMDNKSKDFFFFACYTEKKR